MTQFAVTIDTEEEWDWAAGWPVQSYSVNNVRQLPQFQQLCSDFGVKTTWFVNWAVMHDPEARGTMLEIGSRAGVELGMHIHPWASPPHDSRAYATSKDSFLHNAPADEIEAKLASVYQLFLANDLRPRTFRGGRYSSGGAIHTFLLEKEFIADCSVVPYTCWPDEGSPNFFQRDIYPARVGSNQAGQGLWEIPVSLGYTRAGFRQWSNRFDRIENSRLRHLRLIGVLGRLGVVRRVWLNFEDTSAGDMLALLNVLRTMKLPCICFTLHSSSLYPGGNPYSQTDAQLQGIWQTAETVFREIATWNDFEPATISEIAESLERDSIAKSAVGSLEHPA